MSDGTPTRHDAVVVGGGHNGLVAAAYLARAGLSVLVLERLGRLGGAAVSERIFPGLDARLSRYSYLVSLLPDRIAADLGLRLELRSRPVASYTPGKGRGLLIERPEGTATAASFRELTGSDDEYAAWRRFHDTLERLARAVAPTLLEPLPTRAELARRVRAEAGPGIWEPLVEHPLGEVVEAAFREDAVRGVVLTDALIGTGTHAHDPSLRQNRCFLYHVVGNGTGEWRVPVGGMGAVTAALSDAARRAGAETRTGAEVTRVDADGHVAEVTYVAGGEERRAVASYVLANVAPATLARLLGRPPAGPPPEGDQMKINMLLTRLPSLRSGVDPAVAFAGTLHIDEGYGRLRQAHASARAGRMPDPAPAEVYCHSLTDPSILGAGLRGWHTLTLFGLHMPVRLFREEAQPSQDKARLPQDNARSPRNSNDAAREEAVRRYLAGIDAHLAEPLEACLARDAEGRPCLEAMTPVDLEAELGLPGGHIFHGDLAWPFAGDTAPAGTWGVETDVPNVLVCGSGARRGGAVSGIGGHNAAHALLGRWKR